MLADLSHACWGGYAGKPKQRLGGAGRCLGLVFVIPAANLEWDSPSSVDGVTQSRTETFLCRWTLQVCRGSSGRRRGKMLQAKNQRPHGAEWKEKKLSCEGWETPTALTDKAALSDRTWSVVTQCSLSELSLETPFSFLPLFPIQQEGFLSWTMLTLAFPFKQREIPFCCHRDRAPAFPRAAQGVPLSSSIHPFPLHFLLPFPERKANFCECQNSVNADI